MSININYLRIPLYKLFYIKNLSDFSGLTNEEIESAKKEYDHTDIRGIVEVVKWATNHPDYDFLSLAPWLDITTYSNEEIYQYCCKINDSFERSQL